VIHNQVFELLSYLVKCRNSLVCRLFWFVFLGIYQSLPPLALLAFKRYTCNFSWKIVNESDHKVMCWSVVFFHKNVALELIGHSKKHNCFLNPSWRRSESSTIDNVDSLKQTIKWFLFWGRIFTIWQPKIFLLQLMQRYFCEKKDAKVTRYF
jgi:hypothetical protein